MTAPEIVAVLVVPPEGDPGGLLRFGELCARPPVARRFVHRDLGLWEHSVVEATVLAHPSRWPSQTLALALWWDGALVPEGWDRFVRVVETEFEDPPEYDSVGPPADCGAGDVHYGSQWVPIDPDYRSAFWMVSNRHPDLAGVLTLASYGSTSVSRIIRLARVDGRLVEVP